MMEDTIEVRTIKWDIRIPMLVVFAVLMAVLAYYFGITALFYLVCALVVLVCMYVNAKITLMSLLILRASLEGIRDVSIFGTELHLAFGIAFLLAGILYIVVKKINVLKSPVPIAVAVYFAFLCVMLVVNGPSIDRIIATLRMFSPFLMFPLVFATITDDNDVKQYVFVILLSGVIPLFMGMYQYVTGEKELAQEFYRVRSTFSSFSKFAIHLSFLILFAMSLVLTIKDRKSRVILIISLCVMGAFVYLSYVRGVYFALFVALVIMALSKWMKKYRIIIPFFIVVIILLFIVDTSLTYRFAQVFKEKPQINSLIARVQWWQHDLHYFLEKPIFGHGPGFYQDYGLYPVHNDYLRVLIEGGIVGLALFIAVMATTLITAYQGMRRIKDETTRYCAGAAFGSLVIIVILFLTENIIYAFGMMFYFWTFAALAASHLPSHQRFVRRAQQNE